MSGAHAAVINSLPSVLIVEDELLVAKDITRTLEQLGYHVVGRAATADSALRQARQLRPDVILMDIRLPGELDGIAAAQILRRELNVAIIYLTAFSDDATLERAKVTEPLGYLIKPINEAELKCTIEIAWHKARLDAAVRERERLHATTLRSIRDGVITTTPDEIVTFVNRSAERLIGWSTREAAGRPLASIVAFEREDTGARIDSPLRAAIQNAGIAHLDGPTRMVSRQGAVSITDSAAAIVDEDQHVLGGVVVFQDITAQRRSEAKLRRAEAQYRALFDGAAEGIVVLGLDGVVLQVNHKAAEMVGANVDDLVGHHFLDYVPPARRELERARFAQVLDESSARVDGVEYVRADGSKRVMDLRTSIVDLGDERVVVTLERDVTDERRNADQLRQLQRLEALGSLTGGVAHDFNNILSAVLANAEFLIEELAVGDPRRADAEDIKKAAQRGAELTKQLLAFSRRQRLDPKLVDLNEIVTDVQKMLHRLLGEDVALTFTPEPGLGTTMADPTQLQQVVMNLAVNARDAMPRGGRLDIVTRNAEVDAQFAADHIPLVPGPYVVLSIADTGTGMDGYTMQHMFEPFFTTKEAGKGTGLGLATCYGIVKQSGGHIWVYSEPGHGTVFNVYLPRTTRQDETEPTEGAGKDPHGTELVLLIEDDARLRSALERSLQHRGYRVLVASDGNEAIASAEKHREAIALFLCDAIIPGPSGTELLHQLAKYAPRAEVLFMSGYADHAVLRDDVLKPRMHFLQKPFTASTLAATVRAVLDRTKTGGTTCESS